jgi:hypothetical protein
MALVSRFWSSGRVLGCAGLPPGGDRNIDAMTRDCMLGRDLLQRRHLGAAAVDGEWASRMEPASGRHARRDPLGGATRISAASMLVLQFRDGEPQRL